jgi:hypothetical protein
MWSLLPNAVYTEKSKRSNELPDVDHREPEVQHLPQNSLRLFDTFEGKKGKESNGSLFGCQDRLLRKRLDRHFAISLSPSVLVNFQTVSSSSTVKTVKDE